MTNETKPKPDDVSFCLDCTQLLIFDDKLHLRKPTKQEEEEVMTDKKVRAAQMYLRKMDRSRGRKT